MTKKEKKTKLISALIILILAVSLCAVLLPEIILLVKEAGILHTVKADFGLGAQSEYMYKTDVLKLVLFGIGAVLILVILIMLALKKTAAKKLIIPAVIIAAAFIVLALIVFIPKSKPTADIEDKNAIVFKATDAACKEAESYGKVFAVSKSDMWYSLGRSKDKTGCHFIVSEVNSDIIRICGYEEFNIYERGVDIAHTPLPVILTEAYAEKLGWEKGQTINDVYFMTDTELDFVDYDDGSQEALVKDAPYSFDVSVVDILKAGERYPVLSGSPISADTVFPEVKEGDLAVLCPEMYYEGEKVIGKSAVSESSPEMCIVAVNDNAAFEKLSALTEAKKLSELY